MRDRWVRSQQLLIENALASFTLDLKTLLDDLRLKGIWVLVLAYAVMYWGTYADMARGPWETDQDGHGLFIVLIAILIGLEKAKALAEIEVCEERIWGGAALAMGLFLYVIGQSQEILIAAAFSQILVLGGLLLLFSGWRGLNLYRFPLFFLFFAVPIPGWIMDSLTAPLKIYLSELVTDWLYGFGYPVAQNGVIIMIGQYQLLVKDACVGLNSLFSLSAVGLLYLYLSKPGSKLHVALLVLAILPMSFVANAIRVTALILITYYFGEDAGQGFLHDFSGIVLFMVSLFLFFVIDNFLFRWVPLLKNRRS